MLKLFLDANVLFAAAYSETGASRGLFELAKQKKIKLYSSKYIINEATRNIIKKIGEDYVPILLTLITEMEKVDKDEFDTEQKEKYAEFIAEKDLPVLISAINMGVDFLITLDRKDFMSDKIKTLKLPFKIMLPGECIRIIK